MKNLLILVFIFILKWSSATHIIGGEMYYDYQGNGNYKISLEIYRDCFNGIAPFDNPLQFTIFNVDGSIFNVYNVDLDTSFILPYNQTDKCVIPPTDFCVELGKYSTIINLPDSPTGYILAYTRCCWSNSIINILNPGDNGITITSFIPPQPVINSNPRFSYYPPLILCADRNLDFNHVAFDPDGDSLVYKIITPFSGGDPNNPIPNPEPNPPFPLNTWETGFSENLVFGNNSVCAINSFTGNLTFNPSLLGSFVLSVEVAEYRNGVLISTKQRTFGYRVVTCQVIIPEIEVSTFGSLEQIESCSNAGFVVTRFAADEELNFIVSMKGNATNGEDYTSIDSTMTLPISMFSDTIELEAFFDDITEGDETVNIEIIIENPCDPSIKDTTKATISIKDYTSLTADYEDFYIVCNEENESFLINVLINHGLPPYNYDWKKTNFSNLYPNNDSLILINSSLIPQYNEYILTVTDQCNKSITTEPIILNNQCPLTTPNIFSPNNDGKNDFLIVNNLEDYDQVSLMVFNRWGNIVYENGNYKNDWAGIDKNGKPLNEGVYFYLVSPLDEKYSYNEKEKLKFTIQGFIHLVKN